MSTLRCSIVCFFGLLCLFFAVPLGAQEIPAPSRVALDAPGKSGGPVGEKHPVPWSLAVGADLAGYGAKATAKTGGTAYDLSVRHGLSPVLQGAYRLNGTWDIEGGVRYDWMRWKLSPSLGPKEGSLRALTLAFGMASHGTEKELPVFGKIRPLVSAAFLWRFIDADLDGPARDYRSGPGAELAGGFTRDDWACRVGLSYSHHDACDLSPGATAEDLELLGAFVRFTLLLDR